MALVVSIVEQSLPIPIPVPGAKLGLSNAMVLITMVVFGGFEALGIACLKSVLLVLITGSVTGFFYSFAGALLSCLMMQVAYAYFTPPFSLIGVSEIGAFFHNVGQLTVAMFVLENRGIFYYLPVMTLLAVATGFIVGLVSHFVSGQLKRVFL